jgi:hypothetical protein
MLYYLDDTLQEAIGLQGLSSPVEDQPFFFVGELVQTCTQKQFLRDYSFVDFIQDSKLAHFQVLVNDLQSSLTLHQLPECERYITETCIRSGTVHQIRCI